MIKYLNNQKWDLISDEIVHQFYNSYTFLRFKKVGGNGYLTGQHCIQVYLEIETYYRVHYRNGGHTDPSQARVLAKRFKYELEEFFDILPEINGEKKYNIAVCSWPCKVEYNFKQVNGVISVDKDLFLAKDSFLKSKNNCVDNTDIYLFKKGIIN